MSVSGSGSGSMGLQSDDCPVFVFGATWRTGSTLVQRVLTASGKILVWGEPRYLRQFSELYEKAVKISRSSENGRINADQIQPGAWIPTIAPGDGSVQRAFRAFLENMYLPEARAKGFQRWGFKEVRNNARHYIRILNILYPGAPIVLLVRHPVDCYRSVKAMDFHKQFPNPFHPVDVWSNNTAAFLQMHRSRKLNTYLLRLEDLVKDGQFAMPVLQELSTHARLECTDRMSVETGIVSGASSSREELEQGEVDAIWKRTASIARKLDYTMYNDA